MTFTSVITSFSCLCGAIFFLIASACLICLVKHYIKQDEFDRKLEQLITTADQDQDQDQDQT